MSTVVRKLERNVPSFKLGYWRFALLLVPIVAISFAISTVATPNPFSFWLTVVWSVYFPITLVGIFAGLVSSKLKPSTFPGKVNCKVIFVIPTICREDTLPGVKRVIASILDHAPRNLNNYRVDVVVEEKAEGRAELEKMGEVFDHLNVIVVPKSFQTKSGAKAKGRANQYALEKRRENGENGPNVWCYHLDDDTSVAEDTISAISEIIIDDEFDLAQGVLTYPFQNTPSLFCALADSVRPPDDLTRFYAFTGILHTPGAGLHGEHMLVRASTEDEIGWDVPLIIEDAAFALRFLAKYPGRSTFTRGCVYGASPESPWHLVRQRKKWAGGLLAVIFAKSIPFRSKIFLTYNVLHWTFGFFQHISVVLLLSYLLGVGNTSPVVKGFVLIWSANVAFQVWMYIEGLRINLEVSGAQKSKKYPLYAMAILPLIPIFTLVEALASLLGLLEFLGGKREFDVISKRR